MAENAAEREDALRQLLRIGFDEVLGYLEGGFEAWETAGYEVQR